MISENILFGRMNLLKNGDPYDKNLLFVLLALLCLGLVMVFSASAEQSSHAARFTFLNRQAIFAGVGVAIALGVANIPIWRWQRWGIPLVVLTLLCLVVVIFGGETANGAKRWIGLPFGMKFQPSELLKLTAILYIADFFCRKMEVLHVIKKLLWVNLPIGVSLGLVYATRDLGSIIVVAGITLALLYLVNMPMKWFLTSVSGITIFAILMILLSDFRRRRLAVMWSPWDDPTGTGYQPLGSLLSIFDGGLWGRGLGGGIFKRGFLPEPHTDFILAVIGEELGFIAIITLIFVYFWIVWRAFSIGRQSRELNLPFHYFTAVGIGLWIAAQSLINIGVVISFLPNKGLTLPLISYGGSSLLCNMIAFTILLRVDYENRRVLRGFNVNDPKKLPEKQQGQTHE